MTHLSKAKSEDQRHQSTNSGPMLGQGHNIFLMSLTLIPVQLRTVLMAPGEMLVKRQLGRLPQTPHQGIGVSQGNRHI